MFISLAINDCKVLFVSASSSPAFELQELVNENRQWFQTYGNNDTNLKTNYTDILAVSYISDGKTLNSTFWVGADFNSTRDQYDHSLMRTSYGMLIDADSNPETGFGGADYDVYLESNNGQLNAYLYLLSSTGGYRLMNSVINLTEPNYDPDVFLGSVNLVLGLSAINYPSKYSLLFYSAESFGSNEVRQFTSWVNVPPPTLQITTSPSDIYIRQGESQMIPARIKSTTGFSNDVVNITLPRENNVGYPAVSSFNSSELDVQVERNQPPLFKITVPQETPLGIYSIPLIVTIREPSDTVITKPISIESKGGKVDPEFEISKEYPNVGHLTRPINLTVTVIAPMTISDQFKEFWNTYGSFIGIFAGAFIGAFAKLVFDRRKKKAQMDLS